MSERFWSTEAFGCKYDNVKPLSHEDREAQRVLSKARLVDGRYEIGLLWRDTEISLPNNKRQAESRLEALKRKLKKNAIYKEAYCKEMDGYIQNGHAQEVLSTEDAPPRMWYLPHQGVVNPNKPGKVRVVFDAAAKYSGKSLNDQLLTGPDLLNNLLGTILRFRQQSVALQADIQGMFLQVGVPSKDRDALRFLWFQNGDVTMDPKPYRMTRRIFGAASSPCCATFGLNHIYECLHWEEVVLKDFEKTVASQEGSICCASCGTFWYSKCAQMSAIGAATSDSWLCISCLVDKATPDLDAAVQLDSPAAVQHESPSGVCSVCCLDSIQVNGYHICTICKKAVHAWCCSHKDRADSTKLICNYCSL